MVVFEQNKGGAMIEQMMIVRIHFKFATINRNNFTKIKAVMI